MKKIIFEKILMQIESELNEDQKKSNVMKRVLNKASGIKAITGKARSFEKVLSYI